jgi:dienelactone hydrolase
MSCENCKTGFKWDGTASGKETTLGKSKAYVSGDSKDAAILILTDIFGWTLPNIRLIADHFAKESQATVYVPDLFEGEVVDPDTLSNPEKAKNFDLMGFIGRHSKDIRWPEIKEHAQTLKKQYKKVIAIGYCYGGWACFKLAADPQLIDAVSMAHPSLVDKAEIDATKVPIQILAPENDFAFTEELKKYALEKLPQLNVPWEYVHFPGVQHGFAARGDPNDPTQKAALEKAKRDAVGFFNEYLH